jgi:hypothetical protein
MELYLVKSSGEDEWGCVYWENLQIFNDLELAQKFADKVRKLIEADESTDEVEIENFTLRTEAV